jgi:hypothetical protein
VKKRASAWLAPFASLSDWPGRNSAIPSVPQERLLLDAPSVGLEVQLAAVERELKIRKQIYRQRVAVRRMSARKAAHELAAMAAVAETLRALIAGMRA